MDKIIDKYPFKKILYLNWYEAAIGHLLLFKCLFIVIKIIFNDSHKMYTFSFPSKELY